ncbi:MAG: glucose 1-dehydrogenase [Candidatus Nitrosopolaris sp.]|jgi:NAD(P)-dependent dehydrogenase (short-subunit alcohol dehydrogenase family)
MTQSELISKRLDGKIAVITGGSSGIGLATAQRFVQEGAYAFIFGRGQSEIDAAVRRIGKNVIGVQGDVSNLADLDRLYDMVKQQKGRIDVLYANAGILEFAPLGSITESDFDKSFDINVKGLLFTVQKALPLFQDGGSIILTASVNASTGFEATSVYSATKAAVRSFARCWTVDLKHRKIRVNAISPGPIDTPMTRSMVQGESGEQLKNKLLSTMPLGRMGNPDEIAKAVLFLASDDSSFITGIELFVDGGQAQI